MKPRRGVPRGRRHVAVRRGGRRSEGAPRASFSARVPAPGQQETPVAAGWGLSGEGVRWREVTDSYLVDPASSHMLVSKIKPCMCKYKRIYTVKLRMAH